MGRGGRMPRLRACAAVRAWIAWIVPRPFAPPVDPRPFRPHHVQRHTDYGVLTILKQDNVGGLEVQTRSGAWAAAPPRAGSFVVNIGDMLEIWTCGLYQVRHGQKALEIGALCVAY